jgi:predicted enzyme related to lactoylglutathione lyase
MKKNPVGWFEIPVTDMERGIKFYETVFEIKLLRNLPGPLEMAWFPKAESDMGSPGSLVRNAEYYKPSADGVLIYFTAQSGDLSVELGRVEQAGGKILIPRTLISEETGFMAVIIDTEGNRIALHSHK